MSIVTTRQQRRALELENAKWPTVLQIVPRREWPAWHQDSIILRVWRSRDFLVQEYAVDHDDVLVRLSVNRTKLTGERWSDNVTWDELQQIKAECGYAEYEAVEIYPAACDVVNVENMRHLWIMSGFLTFVWKNR